MSDHNCACICSKLLIKLYQFSFKGLNAFVNKAIPLTHDPFVMILALISTQNFKPKEFQYVFLELDTQQIQNRNGYLHGTMEACYSK